MEKIASFKVNHILLRVGLYVSRVDYVNNNPLTTYDIRMIKPNTGYVLSTSGLHAIEHLGATFLRNHKDVKDEVIYFGPMGCRTGFYLVMSGMKSSYEIFPLIKELFEFILNYKGKIPGASPKDCGNYLDLSLEEAQKYSQKYYEEFLVNPSSEQLVYPE